MREARPTHGQHKADTRPTKSPHEANTKPTQSQHRANTGPTQNPHEANTEPTQKQNNTNASVPQGLGRGAWPGTKNQQYVVYNNKKKYIHALNQRKANTDQESMKAVRQRP